METLDPPMVWYGGKRRIAKKMWEYFGEPKIYLEPFLGAAAVLLANPNPCQLEVVSDANHYLCNFFRAVKSDPEGVSDYYDFPIHECELHARHQWLINHCYLDPEAYDVQMAAYFAWGAKLWIGSGWCKKGSENWNAPDKRPTMPRSSENLPQVRMLNRTTVTDMPREQVPAIARQSEDFVQGRQIKRPRCDRDCQDAIASNLAYLRALSNRLLKVKVLCGDWKRCVSRSLMTNGGRTVGHTAVFLDPPYKLKDRDPKLYNHDSPTIATEVEAWCRDYDGDAKMAICGMTGDYDLPKWTQWEWGKSNKFGRRETVWFR